MKTKRLSFAFFNFSGSGLFSGLRRIQIPFFQSRARALRYALLSWRGCCGAS
jgi:hypothetical protein